jgi:hypothetical protein
MDEYGWAASPKMPAAEAVRANWVATVAAMPARSQITGAVVGRQPFGVFIRIDPRAGRHSAGGDHVHAAGDGPSGPRGFGQW